MHRQVFTNILGFSGCLGVPISVLHHITIHVVKGKSFPVFSVNISLKVECLIHVDIMGSKSTITPLFILVLNF